MKLSIVIPVYNEERTVLSLVSIVEEALERLVDIVSSYELIVIDDGSTDGTAKVLEESLANRPNCRVFLSEPNQGKGFAIRKGFAATTGDVVIVQDADLEYDPNDYRVLLGPILQGKADAVYGSRFKGQVTRVLYYYHYLGNQFLTFVSNLFTNLNLTDMETCYKIFKGPVIRDIKLVSNRFGIEPEITAKLSKFPGLRIYEVPISYYGRTYEEGKKIGWKDGISAIWSILRFNLFWSYQDSYRSAADELRAQLGSAREAE